MKQLFFVSGVPRPQGSKIPVARGVVRDSSKHLHSWRSAIALQARSEGWRGEPSASAFAVGLVFVFGRPAKHFQPGGLLQEFAPAFHVVKPDADKLERAVLDALTGVVWADDSQVDVVRKIKAYGPIPGLAIAIAEQPAMRAGRFDFDLLDVQPGRAMEIALNWWPENNTCDN